MAANIHNFTRFKRNIRTSSWNTTATAASNAGGSAAPHWSSARHVISAFHFGHIFVSKIAEIWRKARISATKFEGENYANRFHVLFRPSLRKNNILFQVFFQARTSAILGGHVTVRRWLRPPDRRYSTRRSSRKIAKTQKCQPYTCSYNYSSFVRNQQTEMDLPESLEEWEDYELNQKFMSGKAMIPKRKLAKKALQVGFSERQASYSKMLLQEEAGCLELEEGEELADVTQGVLKKAVDITSATKSFDLSLPQFGPYKIDYTQNGRHLVIAGRRGHLASFDWVTKRLHSEINVMEEISDVVWLHQETMNAVAQKDWVYIYDNQGIELHCIKQLNRVMRLEFLPYHFLLACSSDKSYLSWLDVSVGKMVAQTYTRLGRLDVMCQNPSNAVLVLGHSKGTVSMWAPTVKEPLMSMLCHPQPVRGVAVDSSGNYLATIATGRSLKIWDVRKFACLHEYRLPACANHVRFSQRGLLAVSLGNTVQIYQNSRTQKTDSPYLIHRVRRTIHDLAFCPYEDILGIGHESGFDSILVPGSGEPNFDALERNPFQTKSQRREAEVKMLLEKIQPEMIVLDPYQLNRVASDPLPQTNNNLERNPKVERKQKAGSSTVGNVHKKQKQRDEENRKLTKEAKSAKKKKPKSVVQSSDVLDRFKPKG